VKSIERAVKTTKKKPASQKRTKEAEVASPSSNEKRIQSAPHDAIQTGLVLGPTFTKMREAAFRANIEIPPPPKKKKIVDDEVGPWVQLLWSTRNGLRKTLLSYNENQFQHYLLHGPRGLGPKYELGVPFHEYLYGPVEKALQDPVITPIPQAPVLKAAITKKVPQELSSTKKKRVLKMKKHKYNKRLKEGRKQRRLNK
jgi:hypothetical protein